ncbi:MAG: CocE/NonD family hydrolase, partial [Nevskiales bacterium]
AATVKMFLDQGYGVISFDQRGFGESTGTVTVMDPDRDGANLVQVVDWAESNLDWLSYRDGNLLLGALGGSYGAGYQLMLNNIDPLQRLDAVIPNVSWYDLGYSLNPGDVPKSGYGLMLNLSGQFGSGFEMDPVLSDAIQQGVTEGRLSEESKADLLYRSNRYFCDGNSLPGRREATPPPQVDALIFQGMHDVLFNFNEGKANYDCLSAAGGDVRLLTYNLGHVLPAGVNLFPQEFPSADAYGGCGPYEVNQLSLDWMDAKLKLDAQAADRVTNIPETCIVLDSSGEAVVLDGVPVGGMNVNLPVLNVPVSAPHLRTTSLFTASEDTVVAGIPTATLTIENSNPFQWPWVEDTGDVIIYVSLLHSRYGMPAYLEPIDDQIRPLRGFGTHSIELNGVSAKLRVGDRIDLQVATRSSLQFPLMVNTNPALSAVRVSGSVQLPVLGNVETVTP